MMDKQHVFLAGIAAMVSAVALLALADGSTEEALQLFLPAILLFLASILSLPENHKWRRRRRNKN